MGGICIARCDCTRVFEPHPSRLSGHGPVCPGTGGSVCPGTGTFSARLLACGTLTCAARGPLEGKERGELLCLFPDVRQRGCHRTHL